MLSPVSPPERTHPAAVVQRQVRADHLPALPAVPRAVYVLAPHVDRLVVVRGDVDRGVPDEAVADAGGRPAALLGPYLDGAVLPPLLLVADDDPAHHPRPRGRGPHDVGIGRVRGGEAALAAPDVVPHAARDVVDAPHAEDPAVAGAAIGRLVLLVPEHVVGDRVVHRHVVHLRVREPLPEPRLRAVDRDREPLVVRHDHAVRVRGVDPHVVVVAAGRPRARRHVQRAPSVRRHRERGGEEVGLVLVIGRDHDARVVVRPPHRVAVAGDERPRAAPVLRAPQLAVLGGLAVPRNPVPRLQHRIDPLRVRWRDRHGHLAHRLLRQADRVVRSVQLLPRVPAVARHVQAPARAAARPPPGVDLELPRAREEDARVRRIHRDVRAPRVLVDEEDVLPALPAVGRAVDAPLRLRPVGVAQRAHVDDVRVRGMDDEARDPSGGFESHEGPRLPRVRRLVDALPDGDVAADLPFPRPRPDDVGIRGRDGERADRLHRLVVEHLVPVHAAVRRLVDAARGRAHVVGVRLAGNPRRRAEAVPLRADVPPPKRLVGGRIGSRLRRQRRDGRKREDEKREERAERSDAHVVPRRVERDECRKCAGKARCAGRARLTRPVGPVRRNGIPCLESGCGPPAGLS